MDRKRDSFFLNKNKEDSRKENKVKFKNKNQEFNNKNPVKNSDEKKEKSQQKFDENRPGLKNGEDKKISASGIKNGEDDPPTGLNEENSSKKQFDKKTYRLKKYSKKYKLEQWEEQRKKRLLRNYYKEVQNEPAATGSYKPVSFDEDVVDGNQVGRYVKHPDVIEKETSNIENDDSKTKFTQKKDPFWKAKERFNKIKQDKLLKNQEIEKKKEEKQQKLQEYKKKKQERFKKLSKKTKKGQPVMTGRLELLLEKLQKG